MKKYLFLITIIMLFQSNLLQATIQEDLNKANKDGKVVFLVVTEKTAAGVDKALNIANEASKQVENSTVLEMDRTATDSLALVSKFRLSGAPLPLILVVARNGVVCGGLLLQQATPEKLIATIPSPKLEEAIKSLSAGKPVFFVVSKDGFSDKAETLEICQTARQTLKDKASIVEIDLADAKEAAFLKKIGVVGTPDKSQVVVTNTSGQVTGKFPAPIEIKQIIEASAKKLAGGCAPGTSCAPGSAACK